MPAASGKSAPAKRPWLIVGAGIHGLHIAHALIQQPRVAPEQITLLDPHTRPIERWIQRSQRCGMRHLRSPAAHNLDISAHSLLRYAPDRDKDSLVGPYRRPGLDLFNRHIRQVVEPAVRGCDYVQGRASSLKCDQSGYQLGLDSASGTIGALSAQRVVLAPGPPAPHVPGWARGEAGIVHLFDAEYPVAKDATSARPVIVGTGLSGVQKALQLGRKDRPVGLVGPDPSIAEFDSDPCFLGPRCLQGFHRLGSMSARARVIQRARRPGSLPERTRDALAQAVGSGCIQRLKTRVVGTENGQLRLESGAMLASDHVILATGFNRDIPGADWLKAAIRTLALPVTESGTPVVDQSLQWREHLFVSGRLAELEIGPVAGNIAGARLAARRIVRAAIGQQ